MKNLSEQITDVAVKLQAKLDRERGCRNHTYIYVGYTFGKIDRDGNIGYMKWFRCGSCGAELHREERICVLPAGKELNKLYKK